ncbi:MAG: hypothetical protein ABI461_22940, partial [Polyangiaceae bacterium]
AAAPQIARPDAISAPPAVRYSQPQPSAPMQNPPSPWLTMLVVFVVCAAFLTFLAALIFR